MSYFSSDKFKAVFEKVSLDEQCLITNKCNNEIAWNVYKLSNEIICRKYKYRIPSKKIQKLFENTVNLINKWFFNKTHLVIPFIMEDYTGSSMLFVIYGMLQIIFEHL